MNKRSFITAVLVFVLFGSIALAIHSQESSSSSSGNSEVEQKIREYEQKLTEIRQQKNTLSSQIQAADAEIYLTGLKIRETEQKITETQKEIERISGRIDNLDSYLTTTSKDFIQQVSVSYKNREVSLFNIILDANDAEEVLRMIKYQKTKQENIKKRLVQAQEQKSNYEEQKKMRETKKAELAALSDRLNGQKVALRNQQVQKQKLLVDTQNDESVYQNLLSQAQAQLGSFRRFVQTSGGDSVIAANAFGSGSDGAYYSQRDARWANQAIGFSSESILRVGCLLTSISMVAKRLGQNVTPADIASDPSRFWANTAWMNYPWPGVAGKRMVSVSNIDEELQAGNYVIVGVLINNCASGGNHFVVLTRKDGNDYIMHDPIYGPDIKFSSHYGTICSSATFK